MRVGPELRGLTALREQLDDTLGANVNETARLLIACAQGCFAAGTKLWTPLGCRSVEAIRVGEAVYSRNEWDPTGAVEAKVVEEVFERFAGVYHLHLGGQLIRTTGELPFYTAGKGWTAAFELQPGDGVLTADGTWVRVEEVFDTGEWELVYNLRVADHRPSSCSRPHVRPVLIPRTQQFHRRNQPRATTRRTGSKQAPSILCPPLGCNSGNN